MLGDGAVAVGDFAIESKDAAGILSVVPFCSSGWPLLAVGDVMGLCDRSSTCVSSGDEQALYLPPHGDSASSPKFIVIA